MPAPGPVVVTLLRARGPVEVLEMIVPEGGGSLAAGGRRGGIGGFRDPVPIGSSSLGCSGSGAGI
ncbi:hypothetical protein [Corynebacterium minutissimum]|nr:hypothetical protein [Corynebacterium minutissimum]